MITAGAQVTSIQEQLNAMTSMIDSALTVDRIPARAELKRLRKTLAAGKVDSAIARRCRRLLQRLEQSVAVRTTRRESRPLLVFDDALPINACHDAIMDAIAHHPVVIIAGETGSGKTTQLPKLCMAAGRGIDGWIGVTQPRRIAASSVSRRIAQELKEDLGRTIGYKIRFQDTVSTETRVKMMTDGILLAEAHQDPYLNQYDTIIVDEAHERSLNIDFILGILKKRLNRRRDLKVIITSATIDTQKFSDAFDQAPVIHVSGRLYPVTTHYVEPDRDETTHLEMAAAVVQRIVKKRRRGDVLVFMPTEQDIRDTCEMLSGKKLRDAIIIPLFARLSAQDQQRVFAPSRQRKIIVATNIAETSITIPGIRFVIDSGLARMAVYTPRSRTTTLPVRPISRSSADQRQGRCGRVADGVCYRLYPEQDYLEREEYTLPEIQRANLADVILRMTALRLGDVEDFPFVDPPAPKSIQDGYRLLEELGAIVPAKRRRRAMGRYQLTSKGRLMARLPLDPRLSCMLLEARQRRCLDDVAVICAALSIQDPRERPAEHQQAADQAHDRFSVPTSDFVRLLTIWHAYSQVVRKRRRWADVKTFCRDHFLSFRRMREWQDIYRQIRRSLGDQEIAIDQRSQSPDLDACTPQHSWYAAVHQSILCGFLSNIALRREKQLYQASHNRQVMLFPGSGIFKTPPQWIVAAEMVETSRLFARCAAAIDPAWLEAIARDQCRYSHSDPHWERSRGQVVATEHVSLYGLIIDKRPRPYGRTDPEGATEIFIRSALIDADVRQELPFMAHNRRILAEAEAMEDRLRRKDIRLDDVALARFYRSRIGRTHDLRSLKRQIHERGGDGYLRLADADILVNPPDADELVQFPETIDVNRHTIACQYRFAPGKAEDGITARVPMAIADGIDADRLEWLVPGMLKEKLAAMIRGLPKSYRRQLVPVSQTVDTIAANMPRTPEGGLHAALSKFIARHFGVTIPAKVWSETDIPDHLRMRIALSDNAGNIVESSRDPVILKRTINGGNASLGFDAAKKRWERFPIDAWDFGDLPDVITIKDKKGGRWQACPCLELRDAQIALTVHAHPAEARKAHPQAVKALLLEAFSGDIKFLKKNLALPPAMEPAARYFGGRKAVDRRLLAKVLEHLFLKDVRRQDAFEGLIHELRKSGIAGQGQSLRETVIDLLFTYAEVRQALHTSRQSHHGRRPIESFVDGLSQQVQHLMPENFLQLYDKGRMQRLVHYLKAVQMRCARGILDLEKDSAKQGRVAPFETRLNDMLADLRPDTGNEKRAAVESFFWLLEEFKISVFAPEIKPQAPVSAKKLTALANRINGCV